MASVCWLRSFASLFAVPVSLSSSSVLNVAFQPLNPSPVKGLDNAVAVNEVVLGAVGIFVTIGTIEASGIVLGDRAETTDDILTAEKIVIVFVRVIDE